MRRIVKIGRGAMGVAWQARVRRGMSIIVDEDGLELVGDFGDSCAEAKVCVKGERTVSDESSSG